MPNPQPRLDDESLAKIALERGFVTLQELEKCLREQELQPERPALGVILVSRGILTQEALDQLSAVAPPAAAGSDTDVELADSLFGRILIRRKIVSLDQVRECLDLQRRFREEFKFPLRLGEILVRRGYLTRRQVQDTLKEQKKLVLSCERCGAQLTVRHADPTRPALCETCGGRVQVDPQFIDPGRPA